MVKDPQPHQPRRQHNIDHRVRLAEEIWAGGVCLCDECLQVAEELGSCFFDRVGGVWLVLAEAVERRYDARADEVDPDPAPRSLVGICWKEIMSILLLIGIDFVQVLADHVALEKRFCFFPVCSFRTSQRRDEAAGVELEERLGFVVGIDLNVLVGNLLLLKDEPGALDEGAEPACVELEWLFCLVSLDKRCSGA